MQCPFVSIIIPMYNSEATIESCLQSLLTLDHPADSIEIIVVDNMSTDNSAAIVQKYPVKVIKSHGNTIATVRNDGAEHAKGEIFAFVDSDCLVNTEWVKNALVHLGDPGVASAGSGHLCPEDYTWVEKAWLYESSHSPFETEFIPSGNFFIKANVFAELGGFDSSLITCEDADICKRIVSKGYKIINSSDVMIIHLENSKTVIDFFKKELWYGKSMVNAYSNKNFDKTMFMTVLFLLAHIGLMWGIVGIGFLDYSNGYIIASLFMIILTLLSSALYRVKRSKKYRYLLHTICLYYVYLSARAVGVLYSINKKIRMLF